MLSWYREGLQVRQLAEARREDLHVVGRGGGDRVLRPLRDLGADLRHVARGHRHQVLPRRLVVLVVARTRVALLLCWRSMLLLLLLP